MDFNTSSGQAKSYMPIILCMAKVLIGAIIGAALLVSISILAGDSPQLITTGGTLGAIFGAAISTQWALVKKLDGVC